ncbi:PREDICTED: G-type lectin S-receptor-like serine/threonine-protein kinase At1g11330 [Nelumbo nucifera]|uniref:Receptor-like serine/threonine-protein kinase n=2 Tax=Nelumbo nucifera TaxID=4432 RepID=A0A1U8AM80_NELNU|nr:PREDICTED: G-type lectin S-receptor-like serine/threonine-protein kinase At1g11330 [Nelumbo nucifera]XP_010268930.1 PREDICTED: G-type lectin S-receptor-like serine/threonine-protein kinase At1g11330 [Nelumbo nucifera]DAD23146.1 TPA_asm: hypothetical protein HUJ06_024609 [Nelumbo nucifera]
MVWPSPLISLFILCSSLLPLCSGKYRITAGETISGNHTIISAGETFALGFFSPGNSTNRYLGIWYNNIPQQTVVWVANREAPLFNNSSGVFTVADDGNLMVLDGSKKVLWSSNISVADVDKNNTIGLLMDSGNLVLRNSNNTADLWQSFDYPSDTILPGMRVSLNLKTGQSIHATSWISEDDPAPGEFNLAIDGSLQLLTRRSSGTYWRSETWDGRLSVGALENINNYAFYLTYTVNDEEANVTFSLSRDSMPAMFKLDRSGQIELLSWFESENQWKLLSSIPEEACDFFNQCGPNGSCDRNSSSLICKCLEGFEPKVLTEWEKGNWSGGCVRRKKLSCDNTNGFLRFESVKLPDQSISMGDFSMTECRAACLRNCSCTAYAFSNFSGAVTTRCLNWVGDFNDFVQNYSGGHDLYVRLDSSELVGIGETRNVIDKNRRRVIIAVATVACGVLLMGALGYFLWRRRLSKEGEEAESILEVNNRGSQVLGGEANASELSTFSFSTIQAVTQNFSEVNKLGQGGFGSVYKGILPDGQEVAVKRLSKKSGQGLEEFMNEIKLIAKLQHRNLVRLLGCCIQGTEKILIYEYLPNKSLNKLLFDPTKQSDLDWCKRYNIVEGIAQGLLYLHKHSRVKVIHRDLKASNILLDGDMNPKISDFGMARMFGANQTEANTDRLVGTFGYMSPEYALDGTFSEKSDVFSFGVLLLEIISGKKNTGMYPTNQTLPLVGYAWQLWREDRAAELIDPSIRETCLENQVVKCVHVGLLCVQEDPVDRPTMSSVIFMLGNESAILPMPREPLFSAVRRSATVTSSSNLNDYSINQVTLTMEQPR